MAEKNSLGSILRRLRREKRKKTIEAAQWTQDAVARRIGVSRVAYIAWESDEYLPDAHHTKRIIEVFRPSEKDEFALYRAVGQRPPEKQNLPDRNALFTGREDYLDELHRKLQEGGNVAITQAVGISGFGGIGKSQIALEYAHRYHPDVYRTALWAEAADQTTLQAGYDAIARLLELPEYDEQDANLRVEAVKRWLDEHTRWLLILNNADDLQIVRSFMPGRRLGHIILTTRAQAIRESNIAVQLVVDEMKPREALIFLLRRAGLWDEESDLDNETKLAAVAPKTRESATELVTLLGRHPLAIDQAGAYIEAAGMLIADYIQLYRERRHNLLDTRGPPRKNVDEDHPESVTVTVSLSFEKACRRDAKAADVLFFCLFLQPDAMPEELFYQDGEMQLTLGAFNDIMVALRQYSLVIKRNAYAKSFSIHRLVQAVLSDYLSDEQKEQWEERVVHTLNADFPEVVRFDNRQRCKHLMSHALTHASSVIDGEMPAAQETAELITKAAAYMQEEGRFADAEEILVVSPK
jgi:DNA-binding XRE family transcriptional regulator